MLMRLKQTNSAADFWAAYIGKIRSLQTPLKFLHAPYPLTEGLYEITPPPQQTSPVTLPSPLTIPVNTRHLPSNTPRQCGQTRAS